MTFRWSIGKRGIASGIETSTNCKSKNNLFGISTHQEQKPKPKNTFNKANPEQCGFKNPKRRHPLIRRSLFDFCTRLSAQNGLNQYCIELVWIKLPTHVPISFYFLPNKSWFLPLLSWPMVPLCGTIVSHVNGNWNVICYLKWRIFDLFCGLWVRRPFTFGLLLIHDCYLVTSLIS